MKTKNLPKPKKAKRRWHLASRLEFQRIKSRKFSKAKKGK